MIRWAISVYGRVQGVGFRFFTTGCAAKRHLTGWVCNRPDGGVDIEVQGDDQNIEAFRDSVREGPLLARVDTIAVTELAVIENERGFMVKRHTSS